MSLIGRQAAVLFSSFVHLSARERIAAAAIFGIFAFGLIAGSVYIVRSRLGSVEHRIEVKTGKIQEIFRKRQDYETAQAGRMAEEKKVVDGGEVRLFPFLEEISKKVGVSLSDMNERTEKSEDGKVEETTVEVNIRSIPLSKLVDLAAEISISKRVVKVTKLRIKRRFDNKDLLDVTMAVATYKILQEKAEKAEARTP